MPRAATPLTDVACRNATCPTDKACVRLIDGHGLYLEVTPNGRKHWRLKYRFADREKRLALGPYPSVGLAQARIAREKSKAKLRDLIDPAAERRAAKLSLRLDADNTFEFVARAWHEYWKSSRTDHHAQYVIRRLESDVFPALGRFPITQITAPRLVAMAKKIEARGALDLAKRALQTCAQILRYAVALGYIDRSPSTDIRPSDFLKSYRKTNYARVEGEEFSELLRKIAVYDGSPYTRSALKLIALTFVRTSELIEATWDEFNLDVSEWRLPA
jgi:hypothetical protein